MTASLYDAERTLAAIDQHQTAIMLLCGAAMFANIAWFVAAWRAGERDRRYSTPLLATLVFLPHDLSYVARYDNWFNDVDHWFSKLFWVAIIPVVVFEVLFLLQVLRFGHEELLPGIPRRAFQALILAATAAAFVGWELTKRTLDDPLYLVSFTVLTFLSPILAAGLATRRHGSAGQRPAMWWWYSVMAACWGVSSWTWFGPQLRAWPLAVVHVANVVMGVGLALGLSRPSWFARAESNG